LLEAAILFPAEPINCQRVFFIYITNKFSKEVSAHIAYHYREKEDEFRGRYLEEKKNVVATSFVDPIDPHRGAPER